VAQIPLGNITQ